MKHFSMVRSFHLADLFTIANGGCGILAIFETMRMCQTGDPRALYTAAALIPLALVFDILDGTIARWRHRSSAMGRELDSLADVISFGVAPAAIAYAAGLNTVLDRAVLVYFAMCGLSRLARFNVTVEELAGPTGKVRYFEGTPIPSSVIPLGLLLLAYSLDALYPVEVFGARFHLVSVLFALSGSLMISKTLRIPKP